MANCISRAWFFVCFVLQVIAFHTLTLPAFATDIPINATKLTIKETAAGGGQLTFSARDQTAGITKGVGTDLGKIAASFRVNWYASAGGFSVPPGARGDDAPAGWVKNDARSAKFVNKTAKLGTPTGVSSLVVSNGKSVKLIGRTAGDQIVGLSLAPFPAFGIRTVLTATNDAETFRYCTLFPAANVEVRSMSNGGRKVTAKDGVAYPCPSEPMQLAPIPSLPPVPAAPSLWFDGSNPSAVAAVVARTTNPETSGLYNYVRSFVNGALASLGSASDDTRAMVAKGAGLLYVVGDVPPGGSGYTSYRDVVVAAISGVGDRTAADSIDEFISPPANILDVLRDSGRLQSMAEAYDLIRGSGVSPADDAAMRTRIANWADQYLLDWNVVGALGIPGHRDNWAIKAGSAVITAALALPDHANAAAWLAQGVSWINESLAVIVRDPGWYSESVHYINYSLNNLVSTAWQLRNAAATDWFDDLEPFVDMAFALRQPNGQEPPFEEGVTDTFPWDVLAAAYPARAATMQWALDASPHDFSAYENQQLHAVTRFFVHTLGVVSTAPMTPPTQFIAGDTHAVILRSDWTSSAFQMTGMTAIDPSDSENFDSRHHMENPLDVVLHAAGALLLPTASGGPTVTTSPDRSYYLLPSSKNIPLVDGNAPYVLEPLAVALSDTIDSRDAGSVTHRLLDAATTTVAAFAPGVDVARTLAMIGDSYGVVVDRFVSQSPHTYGLDWRGRGDGALGAATANHVAADYAWPTSAAPSAHLAVDTMSAATLAGSLVAGFYAPTFGVEETLDPLSVSTAGSDVTLLSILRPRVDAAPASVLTPIAVSGGAAASVTDGPTVDVLIAGPEGTLRAAGGVGAAARLALVRTSAGTITGMAGVRATHVDAAGATIESTLPVTFAATLAPGTAVVTVGSGAAASTTLTLSDLPGLSPGAAHVATFDGVTLTPPNFIDGGAVVTITVSGPGVLVVSDS